MRNDRETRPTLRAALINGITDTGAVDALESFKTNLLPSNGSGTAAVVSVAITASIVAFQKASSAIQAHQTATKTAVDQFDQEYTTGTASFFLADKTSDRSESGGQRYFNFIMDLFQGENRDKNSLLCKYAGIHFTPNKTITKVGVMSNAEVSGTVYSVLSFAEVVFASGHDYARSDDPFLDEARDNSDDFILAELKTTLRAIYEYKPSITSMTFPATVVRRKSLVLFWVTAIANLVISLQHPPELTDKDTIELCERVKQLIDQILLADTTQSPYTYAENTMYCKEVFYRFISLAKQEIESLQYGYKSKVLNQLSLEELIEQSHLVLQETNKMWFQLLYLGDPNATPEKLIYLVRCLTEQLEDDVDRALAHDLSFLQALPQIFKCAKVSLPSDALLDNATVIDLIRLITGLSTDNMRKVLTHIPQRYIEIQNYLQELDRYFIEPVAEALKFSSPNNAAQGYLINLIALSIESRHTRQRNTRNAAMQKQCTYFNTMQLPSKKDQAYYGWNIWQQFAEPGSQVAKSSVSIRVTPTKTSTKRKLQPVTITKQIEYLETQYVFLDLFRSVCALQELLDSNENILLRESVRNMLKRVLSSFLDSEVKRNLAAQALYTVVNDTDKTSSQHNDKSSNQRRTYITKMTGEGASLDKYAEALREEIERAIEIVDSPHFETYLENKLVGEVTQAVYASHEAFLIEEAELRAALNLPMIPERPMQPVLRRSPATTMPIPLSSLQQSVQTDPDRQSVQNQTRPPASVTLNVSHRNDAMRLQLILRILRAVSIFLLATGIFMLLAFTLGVSYVPIIASMSAQHVMIGCWMGGVSTVIGGVGFALSHFFKPSVPRNTPSPDLSSNAVLVT